MSNRTRFLINNAKAAEAEARAKITKTEDVVRERMKQEANNVAKQFEERLYTESHEVKQSDLLDGFDAALLLDHKQKEQEITFAREIGKMKDKDFVAEKLRQKLISETPELRELETALRILEVKKAQYNQMLEKEIIKKQAQHVEVAQQAIAKEAWGIEGEMERRIACQKKISKLKLQEGLKEQMIAQEKTKRELFEDFLREKRLADDIVRVLHEEDQRLWAEKMEKMRQTKEEIQAFQNARAVWKKRDKDTLKAENIRLMKFIIDKSLKEDEEAKLQKAKSDKNEAGKREVARQLEVAMNRNEERNRILQELLAAELEEKVDIRHRTDLEREMHNRIATKQVLLQQMQERTDKLRREETQDVERRQQMILDMAAKANVHNMTQEKQRRKRHEFGIEATRLVEERKLRRAEELERMMNEDRELMDLEKSRMRLIEEERIRILKKHAALFTDDFPRGLLREDDMPHLGLDFVKAYAPIEKPEP